MTGVTYWKGVAVASAAAGPLFLLAVLATALRPGPMTTPDGWAAALVVAVASVPVGFVLALPANWIGTTALGAIGRGNDAVRLPALWALAGAGSGAALDLVIARTGGTPGFTPIFTLTGLACALMCRAGTRWTD